MKTTHQLSRREFIKALGQVGISVLVAEGLIKLSNPSMTNASGASPDSPYHWVMVIDLGQCTGCNYCTYACKAANDTGPGIFWNAVYKDEDTFSEDVYIPRPCMHCEHAPCVDVCPVGATYHRPDGLIAMDYDLCIGCRYCQVACPYGARYFNWEKHDQPNEMADEWGMAEVERRPRGVVEKCTFCAHRIDEGVARGLTPGKDEEATPNCVNICPVSARTFGDLNNPESAVSQLLKTRDSIVLREELGTHPRVFYLLPERNNAS